MYTQEVTINNEVGLHARPATYFIRKANEFKSGIWVEKDERRVNAKSLLGVLSLGIVKGTTITRTGPLRRFWRINARGMEDCFGDETVFFLLPEYGILLWTEDREEAGR